MFSQVTSATIQSLSIHIEISKHIRNSSWEKIKPATLLDTILPYILTARYTPGMTNHSQVLGLFTYLQVQSSGLYDYSCIS